MIDATLDDLTAPPQIGAMRPAGFLGVRFHFGGEFIKSGWKNAYVGGETGLSTVEIDVLSLFELKGHVRDHITVTAEEYDGMRLHWHIPGSEFSKGVVMLYDDKSCEQLIPYANASVVIDIYVELPNHNKEVPTQDEEYAMHLQEEEYAVPLHQDEYAIWPEDELMYCSPSKNHKEARGKLPIKRKNMPSSSNQIFEESENDSDYCQPAEDNSSREDEEGEELRRHAKELKRMMRAKMLGDDAVHGFGDDDFIIPEIGGEDGDVTPYFDSSDDGVSYDEMSDDNGEMHTVKRKSNHQVYDSSSIIPHFAIGMAFTDSKEFKKALVKYGIATNRHLVFPHSEKTKISAQCSWPGCPWYIYGSITGRSEWLIVSRYMDEHTCVLRRNNRLVTSSLIAKKYYRMIRDNPTWRADHMQQAVLQEMQADVSISQCKRAKKLVMQKLIDATNGEYSRVFDYHLELVRSNPGSTIAVCLNPKIEDSHVFQRMYVCFEGCKKGFLAGCRRVVGLDGCFFKGAMGGKLLCAIGRDANNQMYPIAWASVELESYDSWYWFLGLLQKDLNISNHGDGWVFISDQQKGLLKAVNELVPHAEHRMCARHIYANWRKKHTDKKLQKMFWACAKSSDRWGFNYNRAKLALKTPQGAQDIMNTDPEHWCRAYFRLGSNCDSCDNNMCESFNNSILRARFYPIITMMEIIRTKVMVRISENRAKSAKWTGNICPNIFKKLKINLKRSTRSVVLYNGKDGFEVKEDEKRRYTVNLPAGTCSCRYWQLSGLPCAHAISAIYSISGQIQDYIAPCYSITEYNKTYDHVLQPVEGMERWAVSSNPKPLPPVHIKMPGRPKTERRREVGEAPKGTKLTKVGIVGKCSLCGSNTHNKRTCKKNPEAKGKENANYTRAAKRSMKNTENQAPRTHEAPPVKQQRNEPQPVRKQMNEAHPVRQKRNESESVRHDTTFAQDRFQQRSFAQSYSQQSSSVHGNSTQQFYSTPGTQGSTAGPSRAPPKGHRSLEWLLLGGKNRRRSHR